MQTTHTLFSWLVLAILLLNMTDTRAAMTCEEAETTWCMFEMDLIKPSDPSDPSRLECTRVDNRYIEIEKCIVRYGCCNSTAYVNAINAIDARVIKDCPRVPSIVQTCDGEDDPSTSSMYYRKSGASRASFGRPYYMAAVVAVTSYLFTVGHG